VDLELPFRERRKLREKLDLLAGIYTVDLVFLPYADGEFRKIILEEGKVLYEENRGPAEDSEISKSSPREVGRSGPFPLMRKRMNWIGTELSRGLNSPLNSY